MKVGRNDPCPCGSGKKYKKCCLDKEDVSEAERQLRHAADDNGDVDKEPLEWEMLSNMFNNFRNFSLKSKPHIKEYKKIRQMHGEIVDSMIDYYENDKFEQKIDRDYQPDIVPTRENRRKAEAVFLHELEFDMESDRGAQAFYDILVYKPAPNINCITEDFIQSRRYRKPEKIEFLQSMLDSRLGLFDVIERDSAEGYAYIRDVLNGNEYKLTDMGLSSETNAADFLIYTRVITYRGVSFGTGLNLTFSKNDPFIKSYIKRNKVSYSLSGEYGRFVELYKHFCQTPSDIKIMTNRF